jgi:hypothetical protein
MPNSGLIAGLMADQALKELAMKTCRRFIRPASIVTAVAMTLAIGTHASPVPAVEAADGDTLSLSYAIYVSGSRVYKINYSALITAQGYKTAVTMAPKGLGKVFVDFKLKMSSAGTLANGRPEPVDFTMESTKNNEHKKVSMSWSSDDLPKADRSFRVPKDRAAALDRVLNPQMPDPLTAVLRHALESDTQPCTRTLRSYNGAEVYDLAFTFLGNEEITDTKEGAYSGPAYKCKVVFVPVAGYPEKRMKKHLSNPPTYTVWFAEVTSPTTSTKFLVPVQASGKAGKRSFKILASDAQMSGQPLAALSQLNH